MWIPLTGLNRSVQKRIDKHRHQIDGIGVTARYEPLQAGAGDERRPRLLALGPKTAKESSQRAQNSLSVLGGCVHSGERGLRHLKNLAHASSQPLARSS